MTISFKPVIFLTMNFKEPIHIAQILVASNVAKTVNVSFTKKPIFCKTKRNCFFANADRKPTLNASKLPAKIVVKAQDFFVGSTQKSQIASPKETNALTQSISIR